MCCVIREDMFFCFAQLAAAKAWTTWEMMTAHLIPNEENIKRGDDDNFSLVSLYWPYPYL